MNRNVVVRAIDRASSEDVAALATAGVATAHEAIGKTGLMEAGISPIQPGNRIAGSAVTVSCQPGDNLMIHAAVEVVEPGDVLVVATTAPSIAGMVGELIAAALQVAGCVGLVIDAGVRDVRELRALRFPVWSRAVHAQGTAKAAPGSVNVPVVCAGAPVSPGDVVVADDDGVLIVPRQQAAAASAAATARNQREAGIKDRIARGELTVDIFGFRHHLLDAGVQYVDRLPEP